MPSRFHPLDTKKSYVQIAEATLLDRCVSREQAIWKYTLKHRERDYESRRDMMDMHGMVEFMHLSATPRRATSTPHLLSVYYPLTS